jgi:hypothetical protein
MIKKVGFVVLIIISACVTGFTQTANQITGVWEADDKSKPLQVEIYLARDGNYYGKVVNDISAPSKNGNLVIESLVYSETSKTYKGTLQPTESRMTLNATVTMEGINRLKMVAKKLLMSKTIYLTRIK